MSANFLSVTGRNFNGPGAGTTVTLTGVGSGDVGTDRYMYLFLQHNNAVTPTSVVYAGAVMTKIVNQYNAQSSYLDVYELANPTFGGNDLVITYPAYQEYGQDICVWWANFSNSSGHGNITTTTGATPLAVNLSSVSAGSAILLVSLIPSVNYTQVMTIDGSSVFEMYLPVGYNINYGAISYKENVSGGNSSIAPQYNYNMYGCAVEVKASVAPPSTRRVFVVG